MVKCIGAKIRSPAALMVVEWSMELSSSVPDADRSKIRWRLLHDGDIRETSFVGRTYGESFHNTFQVHVAEILYTPSGRNVVGDSNAVDNAAELTARKGVTRHG